MGPSSVPSWTSGGRRRERTDLVRRDLGPGKRLNCLPHLADRLAARIDGRLQSDRPAPGVDKDHLRRSHEVVCAVRPTDARVGNLKGSLKTTKITRGGEVDHDEPLA